MYTFDPDFTDTLSYPTKYPGPSWYR